MRNIKTAFVLIAFFLHLQSALAQTSKKETWYLKQTSEMNDLMINYQADLESIMRVYTTLGTRSEGRRNQVADNYNSPERRQRLLKLISDYRKKMDQVGFDEMSIDGKADYLLFDRKLSDARYRLEEEDRLYSQIVQYLPFSDRLYKLVVPRRRGAVVNGQQVAKELNEACGQIRQSITTLKKGDSLASKH